MKKIIMWILMVFNALFFISWGIIESIQKFEKHYEYIPGWNTLASRLSDLYPLYFILIMAMIVVGILVYNLFNED